ncbi:hypothetical protein ABKV19_025383 [Rosa sericea]
MFQRPPTVSSTLWDPSPKYDVSFLHSFIHQLSSSTLTRRAPFANCKLVFILFSNGSIYILCPIVPFGRFIIVLQRELYAVAKDNDAFIEDFSKDYNDMVDGRQSWLGLTLESRSGASSLPRRNDYDTSKYICALKRSNCYASKIT